MAVVPASSRVANLEVAGVPVLATGEAAALGAVALMNTGAVTNSRATAATSCAAGSPTHSSRGKGRALVRPRVRIAAVISRIVDTVNAAQQNQTIAASTA